MFAKTAAVNYIVDGAALGKKGTWNDLNIASVTSVIQKQTKAKEFTLTMNAISKKATFSLPPTLNLPNASVSECLLHPCVIRDVDVVRWPASRGLWHDLLQGHQEYQRRV
jgi:hypothetical protein